MAMTKKERAGFDAALEKARILGALRWTEKVLPDIQPPVPCSAEKLTTGFYAHAHELNYRVSEACSSSIYHGIGSTTKTNSQRPIWLHSTRLRALKAARSEMEKAAAKALAELDKEIAEEESKES